MDCELDQNKMNISATVFDMMLRDDLNLSDNMELLQQFVTLWAELVKSSEESEEYQKFLFDWYRKLCTRLENRKINPSSFIFAALILETLLDEEASLKSFLNKLLPQVLRPLHEAIVSQCLNESTVDGGELLLVFYRMHLKCLKNDALVGIVKRYGLWKPLIHFYLKNDRFHVIIHNTCLNYTTILIENDDSNLRFEIIHLISRYLKVSVQENTVNDQITLRALKLLYRVLSKCISSCDADFLDMLCRKCHSIVEHVWVIANNSIRTDTIKHSLNIFVLMNVFSSKEATQDDFDCVSKFIHVAQNVLAGKDEFLRHMIDIFEAINKVQKRTSICAMKYQQYYSYFLITTCKTYIEDFSFLHSNREKYITPYDSEFQNFCCHYEKKLKTDSKLICTVDAILKSLGDMSCHLNNDYECTLIRWLSAVLLDFSNYDGFLNDDAHKLLSNVIHAVSALLNRSVSCDPTDLSRILDSCMKISQINLRQVIRLAALNLCNITIRKINKFDDNIEELSKIICVISNSLADENWEIRDSILEILNVILSRFEEGLNKSIMSDFTLRNKIKNMACDEESNVRANAYTVFSTLISAPNEFEWKTYFDYNEVISLLIERFPSETECHVRLNMIDFIQKCWLFLKIENSEHVEKIFEIIFNASTEDIYVEVRQEGMLFWKTILQKILGESSNNKILVIEYLRRLSVVGCFQAIANIIDDEYDPKVRQITIEIVDSLLSCNFCQDDFDELENIEISYRCSEEYFPNAIPSSNVSSKFINVKSFFEKYCWSYCHEFKNQMNCGIESYNLQDLMDCFVKVTFKSEVNEKDCY